MLLLRIPVINNGGITSVAVNVNVNPLKSVYAAPDPSYPQSLQHPDDSQPLNN